MPDGMIPGLPPQLMGMLPPAQGPAPASPPAAGGASGGGFMQLLMFLAGMGFPEFASSISKIRGGARGGAKGKGGFPPQGPGAPGSRGPPTPPSAPMLPLSYRTLTCRNDNSYYVKLHLISQAGLIPILTVGYTSHL